MHRFLWQADAWPDEPLSPEKLAEAELEHAAAPAPDAAVDDDFVDDALSFTAPWRSEELEPPAADQYFWLTAPWRDAGADAGQSDGDGIEIAGYRVVRQLGTGGMSTVWLARRESDGMEVVLKVLARSLVRSKVQLQRFMREYRLIANINSRSVVKIYDQGTVDDRAYIAMEYFPGGDLRQKLGEPIPPGRALKLLWSIARALHSIHARGIVHRDLKPANIMFRADGSVGLVDFGVSRRKQVTGNTVGLTLTGELLGTPLYMSPEQGRGLRATPQSDLYSLGVIFHEMLTGEYPFTDKSLMVIIHKHAVDPIPRLPRILAAYQEMHDTLLAKDAADRFSSARALLSYMREKFGN
jgi:serine/threonine protein kinase